MSLKLELQSTNGNINLTPFLNVQKGDGMDPADPTFTEKVFAHSLLKQGGTLALEDLKLREQIFPVLLKGASKDALTAIVREVNRILNTPGCTVEWQDELASAPTFFPLASGQCDVEYFYRESEKNFLRCKVRLFVQPFGRKELVPRALPLAAGATNIATAPVVTFRAASALAGDAPALVLAQANVNAAGLRMTRAFSVLPVASYNPWIPAASIASASSVAAGFKASSAEGFTYLVGNSSATKPLSMPRASGVYTGNNRILAIVRQFKNEFARIAVEPSYAEAIGGGASSLVGVQVPSRAFPEEWSVVDCGVVTRSGLPQLDKEWALRLSSTATFVLYGLVMLPESSTIWLNGNFRQSLRTNYDGTIDRVYTGEEFGEAGADVTGSTRGVIPRVEPKATAPVFAAFSLAPSFTNPKSIELNINVLEQTRYVF